MTRFAVTDLKQYSLPIARASFIIITVCRMFAR